MYWKMRLLLIVDNFRTWLLKDLSESDIVDQQDQSFSDEYFSPRAMIADPEAYHNDEEPMMVEVSREILADLVIVTALMAEKFIRENDQEEVITSFCVAADKTNKIMYAGDLSIEDLMDLAEKAEVDHLIDYLAKRDLEYGDPDPQHNV